MQYAIAEMPIIALYKRRPRPQNTEAFAEICTLFTKGFFTKLIGQCLKSFPHPVENFVEISCFQGFFLPKMGRKLWKTRIFYNYNKIIIC